MRFAAVLALLICSRSLVADEPRFRSHPPIRPLPTAYDRPLSAGPGYFVDAARGRDDADGSKAQPWRTLAHAVKHLKPGDTLYLRGGIYHEHVAVPNSGAAKQPITIRSFPGELAIIDGGLREFFETPEKAWEPAPGGVAGEFRSVKPYNDLGSAGVQTHLLGNFGDSMVPLHGYKYMSDLRSTNIYFNLPVNTGPEGNIYCGPGICHDLKTGHIHVRLAHTNMKYLPAQDNYQGETDPRKVPLIIAGHQGGSPLSLRNVRHVRVQDLVVRGSRGPTIEVDGCEDIEFDGLAVYGGSTCFVVKETAGLRVLNTVCRGIAAPWTFRGSLKYRAIEARIFSASGWQPTALENRDFELAYSEFTDCVDGVFIGNVKRVRFHHNLVENVSDDGVFITATTAYDGTTTGGDLHFYQNRFARCLTTFAFGVGHGRQKVIDGGQQTGAGVYIYRNVFDYRQPVLYHQPRSADEPQEVTSTGRFASDHGSPAWEPMNIYHNTIIANEKPRYTYGTWGLGSAMGRGTKRRVFNNIIVQLQEMPGYFLPPTSTDFQADGNLFWSYGQGEAQANLFAKFRQSKEFAASKANYPAGWGGSDRLGDPKFVKFAADWKLPVDLRLQSDSPAVKAAIALPTDINDRAAPDIGAVALGAEPWHVGQAGRLTAFGDRKSLAQRPTLPPLNYEPHPAATNRTKVAIVEGYPAFDAPLLAFAFRKAGAAVDVHERAWLEPEKYRDYQVVILTGNLLRAKVTPSKFAADDLKKVAAFLQNGGTLLVTISGREALLTPEGRAFLNDITGGGSPVKSLTPQVLAGAHPWVKHLKPGAAWLTELGKKPGVALQVATGENILGQDKSTLLYRQPVGKGALVYLGWTIHDSLPYTREKVPTVEQEHMYEDQMRILQIMASNLTNRDPISRCLCGSLFAPGEQSPRTLNLTPGSARPDYSWAQVIVERRVDFELLFDGKSLEGWEHKGNWIVKDGVLERRDKGGDLTYTKARVPDNFELRFDWKVSKGCNSGVYYRPGQYEYQILDNANSPYGENPRQSAASLFFCMAPSRDVSKPFGEWNEGRIVCQGTVIQHWLNDVCVIDFDYADPKWSNEVEILRIRGGNLAARGGALHLQDHGQPVWYRNLRWRVIAADEKLPRVPFTPLPIPELALKKEAARIRQMLAAAEEKAGIVPAGAKLEKVAGGCRFTEGPAADAEGNLFFTDSPNNRIMVLRPDGKTEVWNNNSRDANGMAFDAAGRLIACCGEGGARAIIRFEKDGKRTVLADRYNGKRLTAPNDLCLDRHGRIYFTDPCYGRKPADAQEKFAVYRIEAAGEAVAGKVTRVIDDVVMPNGVQISPDNRTLYVADNAPGKTGPHTLIAYDILEDGSCKRRAVLHDFKEGRGIDGMRADTQGRIYATAGSGKQTGVYIFSPQGQQLGFIATPETATNCTFGGHDLKTLFVTAGTSVYRIRLDATGFLPYPAVK